jgi:hypothetical protein
MCKNCVRWARTWRQILASTESHRATCCGGKWLNRLPTRCVSVFLGEPHRFCFPRVLLLPLGHLSALESTTCGHSQAAILATVISPQKVTRSRPASSYPSLTAGPIAQSRRRRRIRRQLATFCLVIDRDDAVSCTSLQLITTSASVGRYMSRVQRPAAAAKLTVVAG